MFNVMSQILAMYWENASELTSPIVLFAEFCLKGHESSRYVGDVGGEWSRSFLLHVWMIFSDINCLWYAENLFHDEHSYRSCIALRIETKYLKIAFSSTLLQSFHIAL